MTAAVIAFPRSYTPRPRAELELSIPRLAAYGSYITCQGDNAANPSTWERAIRLLIVIRPNDTDLTNSEMVDPDICYQALSRFAIEAAQISFGLPSELLRMVALLEPQPHLMWSYLILLEAPMHLSMDSIDRAARDAFAGIMNGLAISEVPIGPTDLVYLLGKALGPDEFDEG